MYISNSHKGHFTIKKSSIIGIIGGHGFLDGVGVHTPGVSQKICQPPLAAEIFSRRPFHQGVILLNRNEKKCSPQGSICPIFFSPWGYQGGGVDLFHLGCRPQKVFYPGVHPPTPPPRAHLWLYKNNEIFKTRTCISGIFLNIKKKQSFPTFYGFFYTKYGHLFLLSRYWMEHFLQGVANVSQKGSYFSSFHPTRKMCT